MTSSYHVTKKVRSAICHQNLHVSQIQHTVPPHTVCYMCFFPFSHCTYFAFSTVFLSFSCCLKSAWISTMALQMCWLNRNESCRSHTKKAEKEWWVLKDKRYTEWIYNMHRSHNVLLLCQGWRTCRRCGMWWGFPQQWYKTRRNHHPPPGGRQEMLLCHASRSGQGETLGLCKLSKIKQFNSLGQIHHRHWHISGTCWCQLNWAAAVESGWWTTSRAPKAPRSKGVEC